MLPDGADTLLMSLSRSRRRAAFCWGFGSIVELFPQPHVVRLPILPNDLDAIAGDWIAVGDSLKQAIEEYEALKQHHHSAVASHSHSAAAWRRGRHR